MGRPLGRGAKDVRERRLRVMRHLALGRSLAEISELEGVGERTISRDIAAVHDENRRTARSMNAEHVAAQMLGSFRTRVRKYGELMRNGDPHVELKAAIAYSRDEGAMVTRLQRLGMLPTAPIQLNIDAQFVSAMRNLQPHQLEALESAPNDEAFRSMISQMLQQSGTRPLLTGETIPDWEMAESDEEG